MRNKKYFLPIIILVGSLLFFVFTREHGMNGFLMTVALSVILIAAHRMGAGAGSMVGTLLGAMMTLVIGDIGVIGILASMGVMAGTFCQLGRWASSLAFLAGGLEIGILYAPDLLEQFGIDAFAAIGFFFLLPREWTQNSHMNVWNKVQMDVYDGEGLLGKKIGRVAEAFDYLGKLMAKTGNSYAFTDEYREEVRETAASQYMEVSKLLGNFRSEIAQMTALTEEKEKRLKRMFKTKSVRTQQVTLLKNKGMGQAALLTLSTENGDCIPAKEIGEWVSKELGCTLRPSDDSRSVVTGEPSLIRLEEEPQFYMTHAVARATKSEECVSGDCFSFLSLPNGVQLMAVCDGMGSGERAALESKRVIEMTEHFLEAGFSPSSVVRLVNNAIMLQNEDPHPITMDLICIDLHTARCSFVKAGASISCIRRGDELERMQAESLPMGSISQFEPAEKFYRLQSGDYLVMVTDGVIESFCGEEKENEFCNYLNTLRRTNPKDMANHILLHALSLNPDVIEDDMLVLVADIWKRE